MDGFTQSALLKALGWSLFDSLWQMALLWLLYMILQSVFSKMASHSRHGLAFLLICAGTGGFLLSFMAHYHRVPDGTPDGLGASAWLNGIWMNAEHAGLTLPAAARFIDRFLPYCSMLYLLALACL